MQEEPSWQQQRYTEIDRELKVLSHTEELFFPVKWCCPKEDYKLVAQIEGDEVLAPLSSIWCQNSQWLLQGHDFNLNFYVDKTVHQQMWWGAS